MVTLPTLAAACVLLAFLMSVIYFYTLVKSHETFMRFWGLSWIACLISLFLLVLYINFDAVPLLICRKFSDMLNILFLLHGVYAFIHIRIVTYWLRFALYLAIWVLVGCLYRFDLLSLYLPISLYQIIATLQICYIIGRYWRTPRLDKGICLTVFALWGFGKAACSFYEIYLSPTLSFYLWEVLVSSILGFCILMLYAYHIKSSVTFSKQIYKLIAENATDVIFYYELCPQPAFRYITPSVERLTGYRPDEFYANPKFYFELALPEDMEGFSDIFDSRSAEQAQKILQIQSKDGAIIWVEINHTTLYDSGRAVAIQGIMHDITRSKEEEETMINAKHSRDLLLSYISHELKTPITAILGYINGLKDGTWKTESERDTALDVVFNKSLMLQRLIQDLVQLSKLEAKQFSFQLIHINALELCENMVERHLMDIQGAGVTLQATIDRTLLEKVFLIIDVERIEQVFTNIIFNALKYGKENGIIEVRCLLDRDLKNLVVQIADDGDGIPAEDLPYIFERFYRGRTTKTHASDSHSGLGLTLSREIIQSFHGHIWAYNAKEGGSVFAFTLPLYQESSIS